jgi:hypothetical protein
MTETDWLLLTKWAANPQDLQLVDSSLHYRHREMELLRANGQHAENGAPRLHQALMQRLATPESEQEFLTRIQQELREVIRRAEQDPSYRESVRRMPFPDRLIEILARNIWTSQFAHALIVSDSEATLRASAVAFPQGESPLGPPLADYGAELFPSLTDTEKGNEPSSHTCDSRSLCAFTQEEIDQCLRELQAYDLSSGLELKEFIAELERLVQES